MGVCVAVDVGVAVGVGVAVDVAVGVGVGVLVGHGGLDAMDGEPDALPPQSGVGVAVGVGVAPMLMVYSFTTTLQLPRRRIVPVPSAQPAI